jgi:glycosyltransferase involved in cell wall biosynthesis
VTRLLITADAVGGVWQYATDLAAALPAFGVEPVLALTGPAPSEAQRAAIAGVEVHETGLPLDWLADGPEHVARAGRKLAELAGDMRADAVQLNAPAYAADTRFPVPVLAVAHSCVRTWWAAVEPGSPIPADLDWRGGLTRAGLHAAALTVAPSRAFADATQATHGLSARPQVVHNGRRPLAVADAAQHDFALTAGRLWDRGKGLGTLDRAAARLGAPFYAAGATAGPNGEQVSIEHLIATGPLSETELAEKLSPRPVFVSAALYEPFGLAVLEAAQAGCALVLSDIPTFRELWAEAAMFVTPGDDRGFAAAIEELLGNATARRAAGEAARARAACYTVEAMAADMALLVRERLGVGLRRAA